MNRSERLRNELLEKLIEELEEKETRKMRVELPVSCGGTSILVDVIRKRIDSEKGILVLFDNLMFCAQFKNLLEEKGILDKVFISTYFRSSKSNSLQKNEISLILCKDVHSLNSQMINDIETLTDIRIVLMETSGQRLQSSDVECSRWLDSFKLIFSYSLEQAIEDGYVYQFHGYQLVEGFCVELLRYLKYQNVQTEVTNQRICYDIIAEKEEKHIFEIKYYKSLYNSQKIINRAIEQVFKYKGETERIYPGCKLYLIMFCYVDKSIKDSAYNRGIMIWDIANIMFLCQGDTFLTETISMITNFSITDIVMEEPLPDIKGIREDATYSGVSGSYILEEKKYETYKKQLEECAAGRKDGADRQYEIICAQIVKELFEEQFSKMNEQSHTADEMFRMDLLCSLKGGTTFWDFLIDFYRTKFVVFEFKNYKEMISQNLIYISEKYLYSPALRNVAFIISRKGFDGNARKAAKGCLIEHGKLILELKDEDLLCMLNLKDNGQEPSDYLMEKVEDLLMGISK